MKVASQWDTTIKQRREKNGEVDGDLDKSIGIDRSAKIATVLRVATGWCGRGNSSS